MRLNDPWHLVVIEILNTYRARDFISDDLPGRRTLFVSTLHVFPLSTPSLEPDYHLRFEIITRLVSFEVANRFEVASAAFRCLFIAS
ncbi:MAG: hypothetical protein ACR2G5_00775 [Pyrinomonadaceae bacterium]